MNTCEQSIGTKVVGIVLCAVCDSLDKRKLDAEGS